MRPREPLDDLPRYDRDEDAATVARRAAGLPDPQARAAALTRLLEDTQAWVNWMSKHRDDAICEMRTQGASYDTIAQVLGVTKSRAQQIIKRLEKDDA